MQKSAYSRLRLASAAALTGLLAFAFTAVNIGTLPGLRMDEAWFGLDALAIRDHGLFTPYASNWYTCTLYPWIIAQVFSVFHPGVIALRMPGVILNSIVAALAAYVAGSIAGWGGFAAATALMLSPFYLLFARHAYEVSALQNLFTLCAVCAAIAAARRERFGLIPAAILISACCLAVANHIIALAIPMGLSFGFVLYGIYTGDKRFDRTTILFLFNMAACAVLTVIKKLFVPLFYRMGITMEQKCGFYPEIPRQMPAWTGHAGLIIFLLIALPIAMAVAIWKFQEELGGLYSRLAAPLRMSKMFRTTALWLGALGLLSFLWFHSISFLGCLGGFNIFKFFFSLDIGALPAIVLILCAAVITGHIFSAAIACVRHHECDSEKLSIAITLLGTFAAFTALRNTPIQRYYIIPFMVFTAAACVFLPEYYADKRHRPFAAITAVCFLFCTVVMIKEITKPATRPPLMFRNGWHAEDSLDQLPNNAFFTRMRENHLCVDSDIGQISLVSKFYYTANPWTCAGHYCASWNDYFAPEMSR
jgi:hypothetical protein